MLTTKVKKNSPLGPPTRAPARLRHSGGGTDRDDPVGWGMRINIVDYHG